MSEQLRESLSAAMDGEADAFELRRVLDEAEQDEALREQWHRYHLVRDFMRDREQTFHPQLRQDLQAAMQQPDELHDDPAELVVAAESPSGLPARSSWLGRLGGTAVAAAVALVVMVSGGVFEEDHAADVAATEFATPEFAAVQPQAGIGVEPVLYQQATDVDKHRQNALMLHHIQQRAMNQASMTSFVKMATFTSTQPAPTAQEPDRRP